MIDTDGMKKAWKKFQDLTKIYYVDEENIPDDGKLSFALVVNGNVQEKPWYGLPSNTKLEKICIKGTYTIFKLVDGNEKGKELALSTSNIAKHLNQTGPNYDYYVDPENERIKFAPVTNNIVQNDNYQFLLKNTKLLKQCTKGDKTIFKVRNGEKAGKIFALTTTNVDKYLSKRDAAYLNSPVDEVCQICQQKEKQVLLIIVGTEQYYTNPSNKMMFMAHAVRQVRTQFKTSPNVEIILFTGGYKTDQITAFEKSIKALNDKVTIAKITDTNELINFINYGDIDNKIIDNTLRKVKAISIYAHGTIVSTKDNLEIEGVISFGLGGGNNSLTEFRIDDFKKIDKKVFLDGNKTHIYSYACRTGIGVADSPVVLGDPMKSNSLAQKMANYGRVTVHAYMRRSDYTYTWGTDEHRRTYAADNNTGDGVMSNLKYDVYDIIYSDPSDIKKYNKYAKKFKEIDGARWNPEGAFMPVTVGDTPTGANVSSGYESYHPK